MRSSTQAVIEVPAWEDLMGLRSEWDILRCQGLRTASEFSAAWKVALRTTRDRLEKLVRLGTLTRKQVIGPSGRLVNLYGKTA